MRVAVIDVVSEMLLSCTRVLVDHGLQVTGSLNSDRPGVVRLFVEDQFDRILPAQCDRGSELMKLVSVQLTQEAYGEQRLTRVSSIDIVGELIFAPNGVAKIKRVA